MTDLRTPPVPEELVQRLNARECILFTGNGIAIEAGYPSWLEILTQLLRVARDPLRRLSSDRLVDLLRQGESDLAAEVIQTSIPPDFLVHRIQEFYINPSKVTMTHSLINSLPCVGIISASWDNSLEEHSGRKFRSVDWTEDPDYLSSLLRDGRKFLIRLLGSPWKPESFIFSLDEYRKRLRNNETFHKFLTHLYSSYTFLFIGARLPLIESFAADLASWGIPSRRHFALVEASENLDLRAERLSARCGIDVIVYDSDKGHRDVQIFLRTLHSRIDPRVLAVGPPPQQIEPSTLDRIVLTNIGPFEHLDLNLTAGWNVLLGNNGCGKSTILRAIALGFCGDNPQGQKSATRLLRTNTTSGSIELYVRNQRFVTYLNREGRTVRTRSAALTPLQAKRSVILGFPALRGTSRRNPGGPTRGGSPRPEVEDLLPLVQGVVDSRLDDAKQWIINTQLRAEPSVGTTPQEAARYSHLLSTYFEILRSLTPGVDFQYSRIDRETWEVFVLTSDGEVPIDTLSQGTTSIVGWVGTLLQRMLEIHDQAAEPENEPALVLVDEIDAHMHPEWQQSFVPLIKKHFGRLQVIATSHSPLVVGNLEASEVLHVQRKAETGRIHVERLNVSFQGWRADQILTGPAFDLETTVAPKARELMEEYTHLLGKTNRDSEDERRLCDLTRELRSEIPSHPETPERREALRLLEEFLRQRLHDEPREKREKIVAEARDLFAEIEALEVSSQ